MGWEGGAEMAGRTSTYTIGSSLADEIVQENGRTYHAYKDGSELYQRDDLRVFADSG
jgi:hypothetical protein